MGNSVPSNGQKQLGSNATINFKREEHKENSGGHRERWTVTYIVDGSTVRLMLDRVFGKDGDAEYLRFQFNDTTRKGAVTFFFVNRAEKDLLKQIEFDGMGRFYDTKFVNETCNPWGGVTKTDAFFHGNGKGLLVVEQRRKNGDRMPCMVTVAHYYAVSSGNDFSQRDIGLSMVVDVRVSNNEFLVSVEGPNQHPSVKALLQMFQEVSRTRTWKRTTCPLYAESQRQRSAMYGQFETESESDEDTDNLLVARLMCPWQNGGTIVANHSYEDRDNLLLPARIHGPVQNGASILANQGAVRGNYNGNFVVNQQINFSLRGG